MPKELVISAAPHETRVAILEDGQLCEIYIEREKEFALVGSIYKGRVTRVLPGMQSAFVDIGLDSDAFLYVGDFLENLEDYDHVVTTVEGKVEKMEQQGGTVFAQPPLSGMPGGGALDEHAYPAPEAAASATSESQPSAPPAESAEPSDLGSGPGNSVDYVPGVSRPESRPASGDFKPPQQRGFQRPPGQDRRPGGFGQGGGRDRGGDRGGRGRGGRWRRGGRDRRGGSGSGGRDLPQSKYALPRNYTHQPYEPSESEPPADYEPIILPGESLAKYKDRVPGSGAAASSSGVPSAASSVSPAESSFAAPMAQHEDTHVSGSPVESDSVAFSDYQALPEEPPRSTHESHNDEHAHVAGAATNGADLSDEEVTSLAELLGEARQEEATAEAEAAAEGANGDEDVLVNEGSTEVDELIGEADAHQDAEEHGEEDREDEERDESDEHEDALEAAGEGETGAMEAADSEGGAESTGEHAGESAGLSAQPASNARPEGMARVSGAGQNRARFQRPMRRGGGRRGHRPQRHDHRHQQQQRRPQLISEMLKANQEIIVQIAKEPLGKKGARITSHVALPGRFLVYMPTVNHIGVSRRIASAEERSRLRRLVSESKGTFPGGFIVRTAADGAPEDEIRADVEFLGRTWDKIRNQSEGRKAPALLHRDLNLVERILRDYVSNDYASIWIDNEEEFGKVVEFVSRFQPKLVGRVKLYTKPSPIFEEFGIQQELDKALRPKVWLKSGGYIVINHTEALVAIDVNTGKYVGRGGTRLEDTIVKTNLEAVKEIIRQIRLRDLGGIIVLDFIDMEERRNRDKVLAALEAALRADRAPSKALSFNEFGLVCVTRKRTKQALERMLCQPCPYCTGSGMVKSLPTICYEIQAEARKMSADIESSSLTLRVHPEIAKALKTREAALIEELEQSARKSVIIQADPTLHWEQYDIY